MPLKGSLGHLGLAELLQSGLSGQQGYLHLRNGTQSATLYVSEEGLSLLEPDPLEPQEVVRAFVRRGTVHPEAAERPLHVGREGQSILAMLVHQAGLPESELLELLAGVAEDTILDLLTWSEGSFRFEERARDPRRGGLVSQVSVDAGGVMLRAAQRMDERSSIAASLGLRATLFVGLPVEEMPVEDEDDPTPQVHACLDGRTLVDEIALYLGIGRFQVLKSVHALVPVGGARPATPEEMALQATARVEANQPASARAILLHWNESYPADPTPLEQLVVVSRRRERIEEEQAARAGLALVHEQTGNLPSALETYRDALDRMPGDTELLQGLHRTATAVGDNDSARFAQLQLARRALEDEDHEVAIGHAEGLLEDPYGGLEACELYGRSALAVHQPERVAMAAELAAAHIGKRCRKKQDRDVSAFFRQAIAQVAPERADLLKRFRQLSRVKTQPKRRVALVVALLAIVGAGGFVLMPKSAGTLLEEARIAADDGDQGRFHELVAQIVDEFPDSPEADEALRLRMERTPSRRSAPKPEPRKLSAEDKAMLESAIDALGEHLDKLPDPAARDALETIIARFEQPQATAYRAKLFKQQASRMPAAARRLEHEVRRRLDVLGQARDAATRLEKNPVALRSFLAEVREVRKTESTQQIEQTMLLLRRLSHLRDHDLFFRALADLETVLGSLTKIGSRYDEDIRNCERALIRIDIEDTYQQALHQAPRLWVLGRLAEADKIYEKLETQINGLSKDAKLAGYAQELKQRRIIQFVRERRDRIQQLLGRIRRAQQLEAEDRLEGALEVYVDLVRANPDLRPDTLFEMPQQITTVPSGARVFVNGEPAGTTPCVIHYRYGQTTRLAVEAEGYEKAELNLETRTNAPEARQLIRLAPKSLWERPIERSVERAPLVLSDGILVTDRNGRMTMHEKDGGHVRWARHYPSLEGVRGRPAFGAGWIVVPEVGGKMLFIDPRDGSRRGSVSIGRPKGDMAGLEKSTAIVTQDRQLVLLGDRRVLGRYSLGFTPVTGAVAAHGSVWVGAAGGAIARWQPGDQAPRRLVLRDNMGAITRIVPTSGGLLLLTSSSHLIALDAAGRLRWIQEGLGDLVGRPARAGKTVAVCDRRGRVLLFTANRGEPAGVIELERAPLDGLVGVGNRFVAQFADGRAWAYDAPSGKVLLDADLGGPVGVPPIASDDTRVVLSGKGPQVGLYKVPDAPLPK